jgi:hypothetical protein
MEWICLTSDKKQWLANSISRFIHWCYLTRYYVEICEHGNELQGFINVGEHVLGS